MSLNDSEEDNLSTKTWKTYTVSLLYDLAGGSACRRGPCDLHCISPLIYLSQLILQHFRCFTYVTGSSLASPGEPRMENRDADSRIILKWIWGRWDVMLEDWKILLKTETNDGLMSERKWITGFLTSQLFRAEFACHSIEYTRRLITKLLITTK